MRYITNPDDIVSDDVFAKDDKGNTTPFRVPFVAWMRALFAQKSWSDGKPADAAKKLDALDRIMSAYEVAKKPGEEWAATDADHEILCEQALAFEAGGDMAYERPRLQRFKRIIVLAPSEPRKPAADLHAAPVGEA